MKRRTRRSILIATGLAALVGSGLGTLVVTAMPSSASGRAQPGLVGSAAGLEHASPDAITAGTTYTYYEMDLGPSDLSCEVLTFDSGGTFTGDQGDVGTWTSGSSKATVKFTNGKLFYSGTFAGTYEKATNHYFNVNQYGGSFKVDDKAAADNKEWYGPDALVEGSDPWKVGGC
jgi:hypothetical protein